MQKNAIRIVAGKAFNAHTEPLFKKLQIMPLPDLITFSKIQFMQRFTQGFLPVSFNETWVRNAVRNIGENEIQLHNRDHLQNIHSNFVTLDTFPLFSYPKMWQDFLNENIKIIRTISSFDSKLKKFFLDDLATSVICNRLLCPACLAGRIGWRKLKIKVLMHTSSLLPTPTTTLWTVYVRFRVRSHPYLLNILSGVPKRSSEASPPLKRRPMRSRNAVKLALWPAL